MKDITQYSPQSGRYTAEDGSIHNFVDELLAAGSTAQPAAEGKLNITQFSPRSGRFIAEDGSIYNLADLMDCIGGGSGGTAVKTFTYTGDGSSANNITFPEVPKLILCISGPGAMGTYCSSQPSIWGAPHVFTRYAYANGTTGMIQAPAVYSGNTMTLTQTDLGASLNVNGETYTVVYI